MQNALAEVPVVLWPVLGALCTSVCLLARRLDAAQAHVFELNRIMREHTVNDIKLREAQAQWCSDFAEAVQKMPLDDPERLAKVARLAEIGWPWP